MGFGGIVNSGDPFYAANRINNAEFWVCPSENKAVLVAKQEIEKDEEILASYENVKVFKSMANMLLELKKQNISND
jgi:hypothetical protein